MEYHSSKHKDLAEQLTSWWKTQASFHTKKELAAVLEIHPDTLGDYFSGRKFPKSDIAVKLCQLTDLSCLRAEGLSATTAKFYSPLSRPASLADSQDKSLPLLPERAGQSARHVQLAQQLNSWWNSQSDYKTKKEFAAVLKVHPDTLGDYFSGRKFPKSDIAVRLCQLTDLPCLRAAPQPVQASHESPVIVEPLRSVIPKPFEEKPAEAELQAPIESQVPSGVPPVTLKPKAEPVKRPPMVISLQRTACPSCGNNISQFANCTGCGQHFIWANLPLEADKANPGSLA